MEAFAFSEVFARFNEDPQDDPNGPATAVGRRFRVSVPEDSIDLARPVPANAAAPPAGGADLQRTEYDVEIRFPVDVAGPLSETVLPVVPGLPTDLNGNAARDDGDRSTDYNARPIVIDVTWMTPPGPRTLTPPRIITE